MSGRNNRVLRLTIAGATDSLGLACGWTVINLLAIHRHGLSGAALLNAAMLLGVALSSPAAGWVTRHVNGRHILQGTALAEALLRMQTLALLLYGAPLLLISRLAVHTKNLINDARCSLMIDERKQGDPLDT